MMAGLFLILSGGIASVFLGKRNWALGIIIVGIILCWIMLYHHATDILPVNLK